MSLFFKQYQLALTFLYRTHKNPYSGTKKARFPRAFFLWKTLVHWNGAIGAIINANAALGAILWAIKLSYIFNVIAAVWTVIGANAACCTCWLVYLRYAHGFSFPCSILRLNNSIKFCKQSFFFLIKKIFPQKWPSILFMPRAAVTITLCVCILVTTKK